MGVPNMNIYPWAHFTVDELKCPCCGRIWQGIGTDIRYDEFFHKVEFIRDFVGHPIDVVPGGGCRCLAHERSYHPEILLSPHSICAIDLPLKDAGEVDRTVMWITTFYPELRVGWKQYRDQGANFIHVDEAHKFVPVIPGIEHDFVDGARW
jgi:hypothetical protein